MGMFDFVDVVVRCPKCNTEVKGFQSKDGPCEMLTIPLDGVDNLYSRCSNPECDLWLEFNRRYPDVDEALPGFDLDTTRFKANPKSGEVGNKESKMFGNAKLMNENEDLREEIDKLKDEIRDLEHDLERAKQNKDLAVREAKLEAKEDNQQLREIVARLEAENEEMEERFDSSAYKQLSDILKAIVVKLPAVDLKGINVNVDGK